MSRAARLKAAVVAAGPRCCPHLSASRCTNRAHLTLAAARLTATSGVTADGARAVARRQGGTARRALVLNVE